MSARESKMPNPPRVILSGFADEAANCKTAVEQFAVFAALGLQYYSIRFIDIGSGIKNVMRLGSGEIQKIRRLQDEYGLKVSSIGSPIGKVKLKDIEDGTKNIYVPFKRYLNGEVRKACRLAQTFEARLIRGFSFYHPKGSDPRDHVSQAADQLGQIAEVCGREDLIFGLEVEANLVGSTGPLLAEIYQRVGHPALALVFDAGNIITQGYSAAEVYRQYLAMKPGLGWMHIKDYRHPGAAQKAGHVDEDALDHFVPADVGQSGHEKILRDLAGMLPALEKKLRRRGVPGVFLDLEPHVKGGGQFGGTSGPDGMGAALRGLCRVLDRAGIAYHLRDFADIKAAKGS
jgi:sugar phosphate isomerase/epimerase